MTARRSQTDHIVLIPDPVEGRGWMWWKCLGCQNTYGLMTPASVNLVVAAVNAYAKDHRRCRTRAPTT